jgi:hypothetical protein
MAINFDTIQEKIYNLRNLSNELLELVNFGVQGVFKSKQFNDVSFTIEQKQELKTKYQVLLNQLKDEVNSL